MTKITKRNNRKNLKGKSKRRNYKKGGTRYGIINSNSNNNSNNSNGAMSANAGFNINGNPIEQPGMGLPIFHPGIHVPNRQQPRRRTQRRRTRRTPRRQPEMAMQPQPGMVMQPQPDFHPGIHVPDHQQTRNRRRHTRRNQQRQRRRNQRRRQPRPLPPGATSSTMGLPQNNNGQPEQPTVLHPELLEEQLAALEQQSSNLLARVRHGTAANESAANETPVQPQPQPGTHEFYVQHGLHLPSTPGASQIGNTRHYEASGDIVTNHYGVGFGLPFNSNFNVVHNEHGNPYALQNNGSFHPIAQVRNATRNEYLFTKQAPPNNRPQKGKILKRGLEKYYSKLPKAISIEEPEHSGLKPLFNNNNNNNNNL